MVWDLRAGTERRVRAIGGRPQRWSTVPRAVPAPSRYTATHTYYHRARASLRIEVEGRARARGRQNPKYPGTRRGRQRLIRALAGSVPRRVSRDTWWRPNDVPVRSGLGQFFAQLDPAQSSHVLRRADLHDHFCVSRGAHIWPFELFPEIRPFRFKFICIRSSAGELRKTCNHHERSEHDYLWKGRQSWSALAQASVQWQLS